MCEGDLKALIISGQPATEDIAEAWANIFSEYLDLNQDNEAIYLLQLKSQIAVLQYILTEVATALYLLTIDYRDELIEIITDNGYDININSEEFDTEPYMDAIARTAEQMAPDHLRFETMDKEYNAAVNSKNEEGVIMDRPFFSQILRAIARYCHTPVIRAKDLFVDEYVFLYKDMVAYNETNKTTDTETEELE